MPITTASLIGLATEFGPSAAKFLSDVVRKRLERRSLIADGANPEETPEVAALRRQVEQLADDLAQDALVAVELQSAVSKLAEELLSTQAEVARQNKRVAFLLLLCVSAYGAFAGFALVFLLR